MRGNTYDDFVAAFVRAVSERWPHILLQWENSARDNATRLLDCYRDRLCTFNDDIQGTAVVATGTLLAAVNVTGIPLSHHRIVAWAAARRELASLASAQGDARRGPSRKRSASAFLRCRSRRPSGRGNVRAPGLPAPFAQPRATVAQWHLDKPGQIGLMDVARNVRPTVLIGVSGQPGGFPEDVVRAMADFTQQPIIFPLSNPTSRCEATPSDIFAWTRGRAVIGTGSPFPPVVKDGVRFRVDQTNNAYVFPGIGLGSIAVQAHRITDGMLMAAARALAAASPSKLDPKANLLPPVTELREVSYHVAMAVALQAQAEGLAGTMSRDMLEAAVRAKIWAPVYRPYRRVH